jgi:hypothetical protein
VFVIEIVVGKVHTEVYRADTQKYRQGEPPCESVLANT